MSTTHPPTELTCQKCHQTKPVSEFQKDPRLTLGYRKECRTCKKQRDKIMRQRWAHERAQGLHHITHKTCRHCHQTKPVSDFCEDKNHKDGYHHICKPCQQHKQQQMRKRWKHQRTKQPPQITQKTCIHCHTTKPIQKFRKNTGIKDGYDNVCRTCQLHEAQAKRTYYTHYYQKHPRPTQKTCPHCHHTLPASQFYIINGTADGLSPYCKTCNQQIREETHTKWQHQRQGRTAIPSTLTCIHCHKTLPITHFSKNKSYKDGYHHICKTCDKIRSNEKIKEWEHHRTHTQPPTQKTCISCHQTLPITHFHKTKRHKDGYTNKCRTCLSIQSRTYITKWNQERQQQKKEEEFELFPNFEKQCHTCHRTLPLTLFYKKSRSKDGHSSNCKDCDLKKAKESYQRRKKQPKKRPKQKKCHTCNQLFPASQFTKSSINPDGLDHLCKSCKSKAQKEYLRRPGVAQRIYAKQKEYYNTEHGRKKQREWAREYAQRPDVKKKRKAYLKKYIQRPDVKAHRKEYLKQYLKKKKEKEQHNSKTETA